MNNNKQSLSSSSSLKIKLFWGIGSVSGLDDSLNIDIKYVRVVSDGVVMSLEVLRNIVECDHSWFILNTAVQAASSSGFYDIVTIHMPTTGGEILFWFCSGGIGHMNCFSVIQKLWVFLNWCCILPLRNQMIGIFKESRTLLTKPIIVGWEQSRWWRYKVKSNLSVLDVVKLRLKQSSSFVSEPFSIWVEVKVLTEGRGTIKRDRRLDQVETRRTGVLVLPLLPLNNVLRQQTLEWQMLFLLLRPFNHFLVAIKEIITYKVQVTSFEVYFRYFLFLLPRGGPDTNDFSVVGSNCVLEYFDVMGWKLPGLSNWEIICNKIDFRIYTKNNLTFLDWLLWFSQLELGVLMSRSVSILVGEGEMMMTRGRSCEPVTTNNISFWFTKNFTLHRATETRLIRLNTD